MHRHNEPQGQDRKMGEKWRLPDKQPFPVECQRHALSSDNPEKHEHARNKPRLCKTEIIALADVPISSPSVPAAFCR
jgi:hypothetical protein